MRRLRFLCSSIMDYRSRRQGACSAARTAAPPLTAQLPLLPADVGSSSEFLKSCSCPVSRRLFETVLRPSAIRIEYFYQCVPIVVVPQLGGKLEIEPLVVFHVNRRGLTWILKCSRLLVPR